MLDKNQIAAASKTLHDHWRAGTKFAGLDAALRPRDRVEGYAIQAANRRIFVRQSVRLEDRGHQRGRTKAHQCRRPDGRTHPGRDRDPRWRHGFDGRQRNARRRTRIRLSHARGSAGALDALHDAAGSRCGRHAASGDRDSGFAICRFRQRRRRADHCRQCLRASVRARPADDADWRALDLVEERPVITCAASNLSVTARMCSAIPAWR